MRKVYGPIFYNYAYVDLSKPGRFTYDSLSLSFLFEPFWIGKGKRYRFLDIWNGRSKWFKAKISKLKSEGFNPHHLVFKFNLNIEESAAMGVEVNFIGAIGRKDMKLGPLINMTNGGDGTSGLVISEARIKTLVARSTGKRVSGGKLVKGPSRWNWGIPTPDSVKAKISAKNKGIDRVPPEKRRIQSEWMKGKTRHAYYWTIIPPDGIPQTIYSLRKFCLENGLTKQAMLTTCPGHRRYVKSHKEYSCRRATRPEIEALRISDPQVEQYRSLVKEIRDKRRAVRLGEGMNYYRDLAWHDDIKLRPEFGAFVRELSEKFKVL